jgi:two-component system sensor histidine kinase BarA
MAANGRADFVSRVCGLYLDHAPKTQDALERALADRDVEAAGSAAHALKSMSYNIGAMRLARLAGDIERAARIDRRTIDKKQYEAFSKVLDLTLEAVKSRLSTDAANAERPRAESA